MNLKKRIAAQLSSKHVDRKNAIKEGGVETGYFCHAFWSVPMSQGRADT